MSRGSALLVVAVAAISTTAPSAPARAAAPLAQAGDLLYATYPNLLRIDPISLRRTTLSDVPYGRMVLDPDGQLYVLEYRGSLYRVDLETGQVVDLGPPALAVGETVGDFAVDAGGVAYLLTHERDYALVRYDPATRVTTTLIDGGIACDLVNCSKRQASALAVAPDGGLYVTLRGIYPPLRGLVVHLDPATLAFQWVAGGNLIATPGRPFVEPGGTLLLPDGEAGAVIRVDPATAAQSVAVEGGRIEAPAMVALGSTGKLYVLQSGPYALVEVDPQSGLQRVIVATDSGGSVIVVPGDPPPPACRNGLDDDGDGRIDFPRDDGCTSPDDGTEEPPCADGIDNDHDGLVDYPDDPGCADDGPLSAEAPQCQNGIDDDGDGLYDFPDDPECLAPYDNTEHWAPPGRGREPLPRCGLGGPEALLPLLLALGARRRRRSSPTRLGGCR